MCPSAEIDDHSSMYATAARMPLSEEHNRIYHPHIDSLMALCTLVQL